MGDICISNKDNLEEVRIYVYGEHKVGKSRLLARIITAATEMCKEEGLEVMYETQDDGDIEMKLKQRAK